MANSNVAITAGSGTNIDTFTAPGGDHRQVVILGDKGSHVGHAATFRMVGRAAAAAHHLFSIHNATGSTIVCEVKRITVTMVAATAVTGANLVPISLYKVTVLPTNGTALTKTSVDSSGTASDAAVTIRGDASADGTNSASALTATLPAGAFVERFTPGATAVGMYSYTFLDGIVNSVVLRALEGLVVTIGAGAATAANDPATHHYIVNVFWEEYTP